MPDDFSQQPVPSSVPEPEQSTPDLGTRQTSGENTSGQGSGSAVPEAVKGWSWGAFLLNWIWGIGNSVWLALLVFVPIASLVMPFVLGFKGREWAWQAKRWDSIEHFKNTQRTWDIVAVVIVVVLFVIGFTWGLIEGLNSAS